MHDLSHTEENYLKAIYHLSTDGTTVSTNSLAASMQTTAASANDMMKRLTTKGLIAHVKYQGANITPIGKKRALQIIRKHRLWEVFLVEKLNFKWDEVHEIAEQLEHINSPVLTERLDSFLGNPRFDPHGDPIPDVEGNIHVGPQVSLTEMGVGESGILITVTNDDSALLQHLDQLGIRLGLEILVKHRSSFDQSVTAGIGQKEVFLSKSVTDYLMLSKK